MSEPADTLKAAATLEAQRQPEPQPVSAPEQPAQAEELGQLEMFA